MSIQSEYKRECDQIERLLGEMGEIFESSSGFVQRRSKLDGNALIQILTLGTLENGRATLETFCEVAQDLGISISASGLHQRLTSEAVELVQQVCQLCLVQGADNECRRDVLKAFPSVHIVDSSRIQLPESLQAQFPGTRRGATLKVQLAYEYHSGRLEALEIESGRIPDQKSQLPQELSQAGDLVLFDLGYFDQNRFAQLVAQGSYFVSRLQSQVGVYEDTTSESKIDLLAWLSALPASISMGERELRVGGRKKVPVRILYYRLPPKVAQERRRKAKQNARARGKTCSQRSLDWADWVVLMTNVPATILSEEQVALVYRLRWQIEILFKVWKQEMDWGIARVLCQFYARCLALLLFHRLVEKYSLEWDWELSWQKAFRVLKRKTQILITIVERGFRGLLTFLKRLDRRLQRFARKSKRKKRLSTYALLKLFRA